MTANELNDSSTEIKTVYVLLYGALFKWKNQMSHSRSLKHRGATLLQVITNSVTVNIVFD